MKILHNNGCSAFTLAEMLIASTVFTMLIAALVAIQLFGMRLFQVSQTKLVATSDGRRALNSLKGEIRTSMLTRVGNWDGNEFTPLAENVKQQGDALELRPTLNSSAFTCYYLDTSTNKLMRLTSVNPTPEVIASFITNRMVFQIEDFKGVVCTNAQQINRVVRMTLEFFKLEYPMADIGDGGLYDYYRLQTCITPRVKY